MSNPNPSPSTRFKPGVSGCPGGKPKGVKHKYAFLAMKEAIEEFHEQHGVTYWQATITLAMKHAQAGNVTLLCKVLDKFVPTMVDVSVEEDAPESLPFMVLGPNAN